MMWGDCDYCLPTSRTSFKPENVCLSCLTSLEGGQGVPQYRSEAARGLLAYQRIQPWKQELSGNSKQNES